MTTNGYHRPVVDARALDAGGPAGVSGVTRLGILGHSAVQDLPDDDRVVAESYPCRHCPCCLRGCVLSVRPAAQASSAPLGAGFNLAVSLESRRSTAGATWFNDEVHRPT